MTQAGEGVLTTTYAGEQSLPREQGEVGAFAPAPRHPIRILPLPHAVHAASGDQQPATR